MDMEPERFADFIEELIADPSAPAEERGAALAVCAVAGVPVDACGSYGAARPSVVSSK
jgi:hypothetical protein